jgi:hypothetical protein
VSKRISRHSFREACGTLLAGCVQGTDETHITTTTSITSITTITTIMRTTHYTSITCEKHRLNTLLLTAKRVACSLETSKV